MTRALLSLFLVALLSQAQNVNGTAVWNGVELIVRLQPADAKKAQTLQVSIHLYPESPDVAYWETWSIPYDPAAPDNASIGIYPPSGYRPVIVSVGQQGQNGTPIAITRN